SLSFACEDVRCVAGSVAMRRQSLDAGRHSDITFESQEPAGANVRIEDRLCKVYPRSGEVLVAGAVNVWPGLIGVQDHGELVFRHVDDGVGERSIAAARTGRQAAGMILAAMRDEDVVDFFGSDAGSTKILKEMTAPMERGIVVEFATRACIHQHEPRWCPDE